MGRIISYIATLVLTFMFTYIFNVRETYILLFMLIILPIFDFISFNIFKFCISAKLQINTDTIIRGQVFTAKVFLINKGILPIPFIDYKVSINSKIKLNYALAERRSLGAFETYINEQNLVAKHIGLGEIHLEDVKITSLFGLFKAKVKCDFDCCSIEIIPKRVKISGSEMLLDRSFASDDEESSPLLYGEAGYDYREYIAGDPLSRVNWKLSSKKNELIIRKSLAKVKCKKILILDPFIYQSGDINNISDLLIEGFIGLADEFKFLGYEIDTVIKESNRWRQTSIIDEKNIKNLQNGFSKYNFWSDTNRFETLSFFSKEKYDVILLTANKDKQIFDFIKVIENKCNTVEIISNNRAKLLTEEFLLKSDYGIERL